MVPAVFSRSGVSLLPVNSTDRWNHWIYIYKTIVCDRVFALYRPCAYPGAVLRADKLLARRVPEIRTHSSLIKTPIPEPSKFPCSRKQTKPCLSKPHLTAPLLWTCKLFPKLDSFSQTFAGRSVGVSRICRVKKVSKPNRPQEPAYAVSAMSMPFEADSVVKLEKILAFFSVLTITIVYFSC